MMLGNKPSSCVSLQSQALQGAEIEMMQEKAVEDDVSFGMIR